MTATQTINQLVFIIVPGRQAEDLTREMVKARFYFTKINSTGMAFQEPILCLLVGLNSARLGLLMGMIEELCQVRQEYVPVQFNPPAGFPPMSMIEARVGGALVYMVDVERFEQF